MANAAGRTEEVTGGRGLVRVGLVALGATQGAVGLWALLAPSAWYEGFPGAGRSWLPAYGSFDEHLVRDAGAFLVALAVLLLVAATYMERRLVRVALGTYLVFAVPHLIFHLASDHRLLTSGDQIASGVAAALAVALPLALLALIRERPTAAAAVGPGGGSGPRVPPARGALSRLGGWYARRRYGAPLAPTAVWAHHPRLSLGYGTLELAAERSGLVEERLKLLGETKVAAMVGCEWCMDFGSNLGRAEGLTEGELRDLPRYRDSDAYSDLERAVIGYAEALTLTPTGDTEAAVERLRERLTDPQLVELTAVLALENLRARFNHALGVEPQGFSEGAFCVLPEGEPAGAAAATRG